MAVIPNAASPRRTMGGSPTSRPPSRSKRRNPDATRWHRTLATRLIGEFFAAPLIGDRSRVRLVVDNAQKKSQRKRQRWTTGGGTAISAADRRRSTRPAGSKAGEVPNLSDRRHLGRPHSGP